ncbi:anthranilate phosphoribosyltransferase [Polymorphobacter fuscus]|uniref:Anthranilate phosphoribosyltransferase n=1 Tax=Sandarakinorhabdus fusca TaxID=1439888 RepID=A0A7C9LF06_9SPHN|nr:anthranilate phosphoribosyltransferase [Polymorphobacter fuscus]KAB7649100.1 anthranilate phosphoribosyltransferase [Polymorphobacter fuscus]MQT16347.1 anthranilate phosphoribosyltransferase [Polymorphobacter fuscus]
MAADAAADAFALILDGKVDDAALAAFLTRLADRGETVAEIVAAARMLRARASFAPQAPDAIDVCGTGGDGKHSLNVSTAVSLVVAACGVPVAKHGNRAASSSSGAADVLAALGVPELPVDRLGPCLDAVGITFLHAARHHPAMARVAPVRRALGRRTIFNLLGPLANPAGVRRQLVGVFAPDRVAPLAEALAQLGSDRAMVVHGDGYDEIAVSGATRIAVADHGVVTTGEIDTATMGIPVHASDALAGGDAEHNAARLRALLTGETGAYHDIVVVNAAAALRLVDPDLAWPAAADRARAALASGAAADTLARWSSFR